MAKIKLDEILVSNPDLDVAIIKDAFEILRVVRGPRREMGSGYNLPPPFTRQIRVDPRVRRGITLRSQ